MITTKLLLLIQRQRWQRSAHLYDLIESLFFNTIAKKYTEMCKIKGSMHIVFTLFTLQYVSNSEQNNQYQYMFWGPSPAHDALQP